jgi:hypothetical protein
LLVFLGVFSKKKIRDCRSALALEAKPTELWLVEQLSSAHRKVRDGDLPIFE